MAIPSNAREQSMNTLDLLQEGDIHRATNDTTTSPDCCADGNLERLI